MTKRKLIRIIAIALVILTVATVCCVTYVSNAAKTSSSYIENTPEVQALMKEATQFILVRHKQLGASHYAYTEAVTDERWDGEYGEYSFHAGSKLCLITLSVDEDDDSRVKVTEQELIRSAGGVLRDPDVSPDGTKVVYSYKESDNDDFHLYEYDLLTNKKTQLTFGSGIADIEPVYTGDGTIVFSSTRDTQTVDCWYTPISNLYVCDADGSNITRLGYDQVHTTYATSTTDGRILYTRWDYNDRNQMFVQGLFQMFPDGTLQTEVFGNGANNPTTLLHTREIPGSSYKYISIVSGHHMNQVGKLAIVDTSEGRNTHTALDYVYEDGATRELASGVANDDAGRFQNGTVFKYPYAYSENLFTVAMSDSYSGGNRSSAFDIVLMNKKGEYQTLVENQNEYPASQMVPIQAEELFNRSSMVNYTKDTGTYYVANVYLGEGMEGVKEGTAKYLRVVALSFRPYSIGATVGAGTGSSDPYSPIATGNGSWDVKQVLGIVPIEEDGSVLFSVPSETPLYFQVLDANGGLIQSMRSWSTLMPGESFSCIGCHEDKNVAPQTFLTTTDAMRKGVQTLQPDRWMETVEEYKDYDPYTDEYIGFDYLSVVQPIFDASCVSCHSNTQSAFNKIKVDNMDKDKGQSRDRANIVFGTDTEWEYTTTEPAEGWNDLGFNASSWKTDAAPFGDTSTRPRGANTAWNSGDTIWMRKQFNITQYDIEAGVLQLNLAHSGAIEVYVNGTLVYESSSAKSSYGIITLDAAARDAFIFETSTVDGKTVVNNTNVIAVKASASGNSRYVGVGFNATPADGGATVVGTETFFGIGSNWTYVSAAEDISGTLGNWTSIGYDASSWKNANAPLGNRVHDAATDWNGENPYLFARIEFTIDDASKFANAVLEMNAFFDDDIHVYLNGKEIYSNETWNDNYAKYTLDGAAKHLVNGTNVIAVSAHQHSGGYEWDMGLTANIMSGQVLSSDAPVSFEGVMVNGDRMKKYFPLSYLVLTGSTPAGGIQWRADGGNTNNSARYVTFISSMSQCEVLKPYTGGSTKSAIIKKLRNGHGNLTDEQIAAIACWIDLCVPCYGEYSPEGTTSWSNNNEASAVEKENKRHIYEVLDEYAKLDRASALSGEIKIEYGNTLSASGEGYAVLYTTRALQSVNVKITLPEGEKYLGLSLGSRLGEAIIYCPDGTLTFKLPASINKVFPGTYNSYISSTIVARVVSDEELTTRHNLALNPYDLESTTNAYPHVNTGTTNTELIIAGRNVIDGFVANKDKGQYPVQAWEPKSDYLTIDYGREVTIDELAILMRCANGDTHYTSCTVEFSDGTKMDLSLKKSEHEQRFEIDSITTTYVKFTNFKVAEEGKSVAITEIQTYGVEKLG